MQTVNPDRVFDPNSGNATDPTRSTRSTRNAADTLVAALLTRFDAAVVDQTVERAAIIEYDGRMPRDVAEAMATDLYVATDLSSWPAPILADLGRTGYADRVASDGREYMRLTPATLAYLSALVAKAEAIADRLPPADVAVMRERWAVVMRYATLRGLVPDAVAGVHRARP